MFSTKRFQPFFLFFPIGLLTAVPFLLFFLYVFWTNSDGQDAGYGFLILAFVFVLLFIPLWSFSSEIILGIYVLKNYKKERISVFLVNGIVLALPLILPGSALYSEYQQKKSFERANYNPIDSKVNVRLFLASAYAVDTNKNGKPDVMRLTLDIGSKLSGTTSVNLYGEIVCKQKTGELGKEERVIAPIVVIPGSHSQTYDMVVSGTIANNFPQMTITLQKNENTEKAIELFPHKYTYAVPEDEFEDSTLSICSQY